MPSYRDQGGEGEHRGPQGQGERGQEGYEGCWIGDALLVLGVVDLISLLLYRLTRDP